MLEEKNTFEIRITVILYFNMSYNGMQKNKKPLFEGTEKKVMYSFKK